MSQTNAIIVQFREDDTDHFEKLFEAEIFPMWKQLKEQGQFLSASLTPVEDGSEVKKIVETTSCISKFPAWRRMRSSIPQNPLWPS